MKDLFGPIEMSRCLQEGVEEIDMSRGSDIPRRASLFSESYEGAGNLRQSVPDEKLGQAPAYTEGLIAKIRPSSAVCTYRNP